MAHHEDNSMRRNFWSRCFKDSRGHVVLWQTPNGPILLWLVAAMASHLLRGQAQHIARSVSIGALLVWALLELFGGVNYFRRVLGGIVLVLMLISVLG